MSGDMPRPSNVTLKLVMAVTGVVFALFVLVHMVGNLKIYTGATHFDDYAHWLRTLAEPLLPYEGALWLFRAVLLTALIGHVWAAVLLTIRGRRARGAFRRRGMTGMRSFTARTMPVTGVVLLAFIVFHILDLTTGTRPAASAEFTAATHTSSAAYANLIASFDRPAVAGFYLLAMLLLGAHLAHGLYTAVNDLGVTGARARALLTAAGGLLALTVMAGNMTIPIAVLTGWLS
ncbi:succinate dehydrogenase cytochrome b subunit [Mycolicibacterium brumae]|uniref:Succinate dehydrogenase n=1 Tax=Mycolicibacterium brumae TaxID=85968 RepID=A0A2G5PA03_9MYCO|nr:succinate dehydrogenase cytochrome b subunit [Mycolicibacterium brumae]MCV7192976.1 succinate dehydrogenase cytochrome b subunit [Mycolicibacterium brumae]PIB75191.1 succinate dehydrogenase [Mycolicibacterium brumae]RWA23565.1 hypothetical protein MBRU_01690 [Mycolicibacterium brumae DSM 44177]UWW08506.1 succinate dehydrogenase cytochrome b subunit [Mycolicibacterium brumae]